MNTNSITNQNFGLRFAPKAYLAYSCIYGQRLTQKIARKINKIGSKNLLVSDVNKISLLPKYHADMLSSKGILDITKKDALEMEQQLIENCMKKAAKRGDLFEVSDLLVKDYPKDTLFIREKFMEKDLQISNFEVTLFKYKHPLLYKLGLRLRKS